jgi:hypothetical protein
LISVAATETDGVIVAKPPAGRFNTDDTVTLGVTVEATVANLTAAITTDTLGVPDTATLAAPVRTPAATATEGVTVMRAPRWISAHQPVIREEATGYTSGV